MSFHSRRRLMKKVDAAKVREAIEDAERMTSGEIRVSVATFFWGSVRRVADRAFHRLGMTHTKDRNGVLFFIVPGRKKFVVIGDVGIHACVGQEFWDDLAKLMAGYFRKGEFTEGLVAGIRQAGRGLADHYPYQGQKDVNELPNDIDFGPKR